MRKRQDRAVAGFQAGAADRRERRARAGERCRADEDRGAVAGLVASRDTQRQVHRRGLEAEARRDVACRSELSRRRLFREHDACVDEIDRTVAVAILQHDTRLEKVGERGGDGCRVGALTGPGKGTHGGQREGEEEASVHTGEFISTKQKGTA